MNYTNTGPMTLTSLVLLKQQIDSGKDYYDYLVPFIEQIYIEESDDSFGADEIQGFMESDFGLIIPHEVVNFVLQRMKKKRFLSETNKKFSIGSKFKGQDFNPQKAEATSKINEVITALQKFAVSVERDDLTEKQAMEAIQRFLSRFQIECIATSVQGTALPKLQRVETWDEGLVGLFLEDLLKNNIQLFDSFMVLVQGNMLANALIGSDTRTPPDTFRKTTFYFDTPNLLNALGYSGEEGKKLANELIKLLKRLNGRIAVFEHTIDEAKNIIIAAANNLENHVYAQKPLNLVARKNEWRKSDLLIWAEKISEDCEQLDFTIKPTPTYNERYQIDEQKFKELLEHNNVNNYQGQSTAQSYDINSIRSIYALRRDNIPKRIEDANAILVTNNSSFARASFIYAKYHNKVFFGFGAAISNFTVTNMAWLKAPDFASNLIDAQTIALAYSAMHLPQSELEAFLQKAQSLSQAGAYGHDELQLLRSSPHLQEELIRVKVKGDSLDKEEAVSSVLAKVNAVHSAEADEAKSKLRMEQEARRKDQLELRKLREKVQKEEENRAKRCDRVRRIGGDTLIFILAATGLGFLIHIIMPTDSWYHSFTYVPYLLITVIFVFLLIRETMIWTGRWQPIINTRFVKRLRLFCRVNNDE